jgi:hypothetical protein
MNRNPYTRAGIVVGVNIIRPFKFGYGREPNLFKMPVCRKSQYNTFGKSVRQMKMKQ